VLLAAVAGVLVCLPLNACLNEGKVLYAEYVDIPSEGWDKLEYCEFDTAKSDSTLLDSPGRLYDMFLSIRHTGTCPYATLVLPAVQSVDSCSTLPDTLRVRLTDGAGEWRGNASKGIYTLTDTIAIGTALPSRYSLRLFHAMPCRSLTGLLGVGLIIERHDNS